MKNIIHYILIIILLLFTGCNKKNRIEQRVDSDGFISEYHFSDNVLYYYKQFYPSGKLAYEVNIVNDLPDGPEIEYYEDGSIKMQGNRINNIEAGWYHYYNINQQVDSVIEYIPINADNPLGLFFKDNDKYIQDSAIYNRHITYKNGEIVDEKSLYFDVYLREDTVLLGDTVNVSVDFVNQSNNQKNEFKIWFRDGDYAVIASYEKDRGQLVNFYFIAKTIGKQTLDGMIEEYLPSGEIKNWFFAKEYYVK
jgi:antitoxin component YwqK of YwqJK toxin-antitoxin module